MTILKSSQAPCNLLFALLLIAFSNNSLADIESDIINKLAIGEQLAQYSYRWDGKDSTGFTELFTEDGIMERWLAGSFVEGSRVEGRAAIGEYARQSHQGRLADRQTRHHFSALVFLELTEENAVTENMALITHQRAHDRAAFISGGGIYRNYWEKTDDGWLIGKRVLFSDSFSPGSSRPDFRLFR